MSTLTDQVAATEQAADKWYLRLKKETTTIFLGFALCSLIWNNVKEYRKDKAHQLEVDRKDSDIANERRINDELNREVKAASEETIKAQRETIDVLKWSQAKSSSSGH